MGQGVYSNNVIKAWKFASIPVKKRKFTCLYTNFYNSAQIETWNILIGSESKFNFQLNGV